MDNNNNNKLVANDEHAITELQLYLENDSTIYHDNIIPTLKNLAKKKVKNTYDSKLAIKAWLNIVIVSLKKYSNDFGGVWFNLLNTNDRLILANNLSDRFNEQLEEITEQIKSK